MTTSKNRLQEEWQTLHELAATAGFWSIATPVDLESGQHWHVTVNGRAIAEAGPADDQVRFAEKLELHIRLPGDYPDSPPVIRIETPVFHPNIPADGLLVLEDIGLSWRADLTLDLVLERVWNVLRGSHVDPANAINVGAGQWYSRQNVVPMPVDLRPLSGKIPDSRNVVRYRKRGRPFTRLPSGQRYVIDDDPVAPDGSDETPIHFID